MLSNALDRLPFRALLALAMLLASGCAPPKPGLIRFKTPNKTATLTIDDTYVGPMKRVNKGVRIAPGKHTITIDEEGHFPFDVVVDVPENGTVVVPVTLKPIPD